MSNNLALAIKVGFDSAAVEQGLTQMQAQYRTALTQMQTASSKISLFGPMKRETEELRKTWEQAQANLGKLAREIKSTENPSKELTNQFAAAKREAQAAKLAFKQKEVALEELRRELKASGLAAKDVATQQAQLRTSILATREALLRLKTVEAARSTLGVRGNDSITAEITQAQLAYEALKQSGLASTSELARAKLALSSRVRELRGELSGIPGAFDRIRSGALGLIAATAGITLAVREAIQFESAMADVKKVVDFDTPTGFTRLTRDLKDLSREMPVSAVGLAKIAEAGGQMGIASKDLKGFVEITAKMSTAFQMLPEEAGTAVGKLLNLFSLSMPEMEKLGDVINQLGNKTNATEKDIINVLVRTGGMAKQFGLSAEQTSALATAMLSLGKTPEIASTAINALLLKLQTGKTQSKEFQDALLQIGLSSRELANDIAANPQKALEKFLGIIAQLDKQSRAETLAHLFGMEYSDDIAALVEGLGQYQKAVVIAADKTHSAGSMNREFGERIKTTEAQLQLAKNAITEAAIALGSTFLPVIVLAAKSVAALAHNLADLIEHFPRTSAAAAGAISVLLGFGALRGIWGIGAVAVTLFTDKLVLMNGAATLASGGGLAALSSRVVSLAPQVAVLTAAFTGAYWAGGKLAEMALGETEAQRKYSDQLTQTIQIHREFNALKDKLAKMNMSPGAIEQVQQAKLAALADRNSYQQNLQAAQTYVNGATALYQKLANERRRLAQLQSNLSDAEMVEQKRMAEELLRARVNAMEQEAQKHKTALDAALNEERQYVERVNALHAKLYDAQTATEDRLREIKRRGMTDEQQQADILAQAKEKQSKASWLAFQAEQAAVQGRTKDAERLAQLAQHEAEGSQSLAERLKDNQQTYDLVAKGGWLVERAIRAEIYANAVAADAAAEKAQVEQTAYQNTLALIERLTAEIKAFTTKDTRIQIQAEISDAQTAIGQIKEEIAALKDKTITVTVVERTVAARREGGPIGLQRGGALPGYGGGDRVPALLEDGEFVLRKEAVRKYGLGLIWKMNRMRLDLGRLPRFAIGGLVGASLPALPMSTATTEPLPMDIVTVNLNVGNQHFRMQTERQQAKQLVATLKYLDRGSV